MDVNGLYTNIDHDEGSEACYRKLETRKNKSIPSKVIKNLTLLVLRKSIFSFGNKYFHQISGTAMGTPMAPNYSNLFMDKFENDLLNDYFKAHGKKPIKWLRYIDDIFFIWTHGADELKQFIEFAQNYSKQKNMKSDIKFDINQSTSQVNFLDVVISINNGKL